MLHDRILVELDREAGERRSSGGIVIPATAAMGARRLAWSRVIAVGPHARAVEVGDRVLFDPEDKAEVEVHGEVYVVMRERDVHAVAAERLDAGSTGALTSNWGSACHAPRGVVWRGRDVPRECRGADGLPMPRSCRPSTTPLGCA